MKRYLIPALLLALAACSQAPVNLDETATSVAPLSFGSSSNDYGNDVSVQTSQGIIYAVGDTYGALNGSQQGNGDAFLRRYDREGGLIWGRQFGTTQYDSAQSVATDNSANAYVVGYTYGSLAGSRGQADAFIRKYNKSGTVVWTRQFGTSENDSAYGVTTDSSGNAYVVGSTAGNLAASPSLSDDAFIRKYNSSGSVVWTRQFTFGGYDYATAQGVAVDGGGAVYVGGYTSGLDSSGFVRKFNNAGTTIWTRVLDNGSDEYVYDISARGSYVYVAGFTYGTYASPNQGGADVFVRRYNTSGTNLWTKQFGTSAEDIGQGVSIDSSGNAYVTGYTSGSISGSNQGLSDVFVRKYNTSGSSTWTKQFGTSAYDLPGDIATYSTTESYLIGTTSGTIAGSNHGGSDAFLRRISGSSGNPVWTDQ